MSAVLWGAALWSGVTWLVVALPALSGAVLALVRPASRSTAVVATLAVAVLTAAATLGAAARGGSVRVPFVAGSVFELSFDPLAGTIGVVVVVVAVLVLVFAAGDVGASFARFGGLMLLFVAAVLATVAATTLPTLIVAWEVMGATSYALIGFDWRRRAAVAGGSVAFVTTRTADLGLYLAAGAALASGTGLALADLAGASPGWRLVIGAGIVTAALGKAAQLPFAFWLSRAMEGPSPVSALLHSAAMVAMGGYLLLRVADLLALTPSLAAVTAWVGALTAVALGVVALAQSDLKQVLAASTAAQLGFVVLAAGAGGITAGTLQLIAHAATKALLFLAAGAWLSTLGTKQLDGLRGAARRHRGTGVLATIGLLSLAGIAPLSLWASKEAVLGVTLERSGLVLWGIGLLGAALSAGYAGRVLQVLWDTLPTTAGVGEKSRQVPLRIRPAMLLPMAVLAVGALVLGLLAFPPAVGALGAALGDPLEVPAAAELIGSAVLALVVLVLAWRWPPPTLEWARRWLGLEGAARAVLLRPTDRLARVLARFDDRVLDAAVDGAARRTLAAAAALGRFDESGVDGLVDRVGRTARAAARLVRRSQTGQVHQYYLQSAAVLAAVAVVLVLLSS